MEISTTSPCPPLAPGPFIERYVNPFTDFGFKKIFGEEPNKDLLMDFLNELLKDEQGAIVDLTYLKNEQLGRAETDKRAVFDLYCTNEKGEKFIVEMQKAKQNFFKDRTVYYSTFPIQEQARQGAGWNYELKAVYAVAILDFVFDEDRADPDKFRYDVKLTDIETFKVFYDKLTFVYLEMPKFKKGLDELETRFDKWLFVLKNLSRLHDLPDRLRERVFEKLFKAAEIAKFSKEEARAYEDSLKYYRDIKNSIDTARDEGRLEGKAEGLAEGEARGVRKGKLEGKAEGLAEGEAMGVRKGKLETARQLMAMGLPVEQIAKATGLSAEEISAKKQKPQGT